jgi:hypothetical protein
MFRQVQKLRRLAKDLEKWSDKSASEKVLEDTYGIGVVPGTNPEYLNILIKSLDRIPASLVKDCLITKLGFEDMGVSKEFYPNHGKYIDGGTLILNEKLLDDKSVDVCKEGNELNKLDQTFYHELGHGWDNEKGKVSPSKKDLSLQPEWLSLSGWSDKPSPGLRRLIIREKGFPELKDDWYYSPEAGFTRFYAKRNPWDDWADSFAYYVSGLKSFLPENKIKYFDERLSNYFEEN